MFLAVLSCTFQRYLAPDFLASRVHSYPLRPPSWFHLIASGRLRTSLPDSSRTFYLRDLLCMRHELSKAKRRWTMAAGSSCWCRSVINLALNCGRYQLRLASSESSKHTAKGGRYQRWLFWLLVGSGTAGLAAHNKLWERKQRRKLRVQIEGIGRFFRSICISFEVLSPPEKCVNWCVQTQLARGSSSHLRPFWN